MDMVGLLPSDDDLQAAMVPRARWPLTPRLCQALWLVHMLQTVTEQVWLMPTPDNEAAEAAVLDAIAVFANRLMQTLYAR